MKERLKVREITEIKLYRQSMSREIKHLLMVAFSSWCTVKTTIIWAKKKKNGANESLDNGLLWSDVWHDINAFRETDLIQKNPFWDRKVRWKVAWSCGLRPLHKRSDSLSVKNKYKKMSTFKKLILKDRFENTVCVWVRAHMCVRLVKSAWFLRRKKPLTPPYALTSVWILSRCSRT